MDSVFFAKKKNLFFHQNGKFSILKAMDICESSSTLVFMVGVWFLSMWEITSISKSLNLRVFETKVKFLIGKILKIC